MRDGQRPSTLDASRNFKLWTLNFRLMLDSPFLARTAAVVGYGRYVFDGGDFQPDCLQGANSRFPARAGTFHADFDLAHTVGHGLAGGIPRHLRRPVCPV